MEQSAKRRIHLLSITILLGINLWSSPLTTEARWEQVLMGFLTLLATVCSQWLGLVWIVGRSRRHFPALEQFSGRLVFSLCLGVVWVMTLMLLYEWAGTVIFEKGPFQVGPVMIFSFALNAAVFSLTGIGVTEWMEYYGRLRQSEKEKEELFRLNLLAQYDSLKQQVNPHFLFNSLNSLSSLIAIDPARAETFVEEMSHVYRYLLQSNSEELTPLHRELSFIRSYLHLLQTRFGEALQVTLDVPEQRQGALIPPLTLQLLVENAVKHNEVSTGNPLRLSIRVTDEGRLEVVNNLQKRLVAMPSEKVGLANIIAKYRLLGKGAVSVLETEDSFSVTLPLV